MSHIFRKNGTAVITGGAGGIGLALAKKCAKAGMRVLVADKNASLLAQVPSSVASTLEMDVSSPADWTKLKSRIDADFSSKISLLALNAGVGPKSSWESGPEPFHLAMDVNFFGVVNGVAALLPQLRQHASADERAAIVITGSKQGITNPPGNPAYNASKAAVKSLAEQLSYDLRAEAPALSVHLLVPGWTWTGLAGDDGSGREKPAAAWWPEQVVDFLEKKMDEGSFWALCPDNDVTETMDRKRMLWGAGDAVEGRPPLSRWRDEHKDAFAAHMAKD